tara:strand:- start:1211 stop:1753 length:543 start_codon:yes stop_codon:yes gene_type:complete
VARKSTKYQRRFARSFGKLLVKEAKKNLGGRGSGKLKGSLKAKVTQKGYKLNIALTGAKHNEFINQGVSGTKTSQSYKDEKGNKKKSSFQFKKMNVNIGAIMKFISRKNIKARDELGRYIRTKSLAYLISRSVASKGIKSSSHMSKAWLKLKKRYTKGLMKAVQKDLEEDIRKEQQNNIQ